MKKTFLAAMAVVFFIAISPSLGLAEITVKRDHNGEIQSVSTNTKGIGAKIESQYRKEGSRSYLVQRGGSFEIKIDLSKVVRGENLRKQEREERKRERARKRGKEYVPEKDKPDYYTLLFTYSVGRGADLAHDTGENPYGRNFLAEGLKVEISLDGNPIELIELEQRGHGSGLWHVRFRITEKELTEIAKASRMDFMASNKRTQSIAWHVKEADLDELKEFCVKYAGVEVEAAPSLKRDEPVKIIGLYGEGASPKETVQTDKSEKTDNAGSETKTDVKKEIDKIKEKIPKIPKRLPF